MRSAMHDAALVRSSPLVRVYRHRAQLFTDVAELTVRLYERAARARRLMYF